MHTSATHRARIIEAPAAHANHASTTVSPQLRRQAELFRQLQAGAAQQAPDEHASETDLTEQPLDRLSLDYVEDSSAEDEGSAPDDHGGDENEGNEDGRGDEDSVGSMCAESGLLNDSITGVGHPRMPGGSASTYASFQGRLGDARSARSTQPHGAPTVAVQAPAKATRDVPRVIESILTQIGDFCSNPAVLTRGDWHMTMPIDPAQLPSCTLSLTLSHFDLTLRFETNEERSRLLILQHQATLRESLDQVTKARFDTPRSIEIIVT